MCNNVSVDIDKYRQYVALEEAVQSFFNDYLNKVEESDSGYLFHPIHIGCCRVMKMKPLGELIEKMRELSGAAEDTLSRSATKKGYNDE